VTLAKGHNRPQVVQLSRNLPQASLCKRTGVRPRAHVHMRTRLTSEKHPTCVQSERPSASAPSENAMQCGAASPSPQCSQAAIPPWAGSASVSR